jgi:hypothetical protein
MLQINLMLNEDNKDILKNLEKINTKLVKENSHG